ncbi:MAG: hypothetical protein ACFFCS_13815 [Candidatus Hodarchaeota archaeon]
MGPIVENGILIAVAIIVVLIVVGVIFGVMNWLETQAVDLFGGNFG